MMMHVERITKTNQIKIKTSMLKSGLCDYSDAYTLVKGTISIAQVLAPGEPDNVGKEAVFILFTKHQEAYGNTIEMNQL